MNPGFRAATLEEKMYEVQELESLTGQLTNIIRLDKRK
jgi:hypothetical protein